MIQRHKYYLLVCIGIYIPCALANSIQEDSDFSVFVSNLIDNIRTEKAALQEQIGRQSGVEFTSVSSNDVANKQQFVQQYQDSIAHVIGRIGQTEAVINALRQQEAKNISDAQIAVKEVLDQQSNVVFAQMSQDLSAIQSTIKNANAAIDNQNTLFVQCIQQANTQSKQILQEVVSSTITQHKISVAQKRRVFDDGLLALHDTAVNAISGMQNTMQHNNDVLAADINKTEKKIESAIDTGLSSLAANLNQANNNLQQKITTSRGDLLRLFETQSAVAGSDIENVTHTQATEIANKIRASSNDLQQKLQSFGANVGTALAQNSAAVSIEENNMRNNAQQSLSQLATFSNTQMQQIISELQERIAIFDNTVNSKLANSGAALSNQINSSANELKNDFSQTVDDLTVALSDFNLNIGELNNTIGSSLTGTMNTVADCDLMKLSEVNLKYTLLIHFLLQRLSEAEARIDSRMEEFRVNVDVQTNASADEAEQAIKDLHENKKKAFHELVDRQEAESDILEDLTRECCDRLEEAINASDNFKNTVKVDLIILIVIGSIHLVLELVIITLLTTKLPVFSVLLFAYTVAVSLYGQLLPRILGF